MATYFCQKADSCHLSLASGLAGTGDRVVIFSIYSGPFSAHSGQLFGRIYKISNRSDLIVLFLFGLTYYIFDFGLPRKALLTSITMAHLALFLPFQVLLQALVLQKSVLFMPVLYIIFGMPVDVMLVIGFYSWGMTWSFRSEGP